MSARTRAKARKKKWRRYSRLAAKWKRLYHRAKAKIKPKPKAGQLSAHFNVREFHCHNGAKVPQAAYPALQRLCRNQLEPMRAKFGACHVNSGYRTRAYNASIGGASMSQHIYEDGPDSVAADTTYAKGTASEWAAYARRLSGVGGVGQYSSFVHIDNGPRRDWSG